MFIKQNDVDDVVFENGVVIENVNSFKYLGVYLDCNLNFIGHIDALKRKIAPIVGVFRKLRYVVPRSLQKAVFHSFFDNYKFLTIPKIREIPKIFLEILKVSFSCREPPD
jgi:hypothetical protein